MKVEGCQCRRGKCEKGRRMAKKGDWPIARRHGAARAQSVRVAFHNDYSGCATIAIREV